MVVSAPVPPHVAGLGHVHVGSLPASGSAGRAAPVCRSPILPQSPKQVPVTFTGGDPPSGSVTRALGFVPVRLPPTASPQPLNRKLKFPIVRFWLTMTQLAGSTVPATARAPGLPAIQPSIRPKKVRVDGAEIIASTNFPFPAYGPCVG